MGKRNKNKQTSIHAQNFAYKQEISWAIGHRRFGSKHQAASLELDNFEPRQYNLNAYISLKYSLHINHGITHDTSNGNKVRSAIMNQIKLFQDKVSVLKLVINTKIQMA